MHRTYKVIGLLFFFLFCSAEAGSDAGAGCGCSDDNYSSPGSGCGCADDKPTYSAPAVPDLGSCGPALAAAKEQGRNDLQMDCSGVAARPDVKWEELENRCGFQLAKTIESMRQRIREAELAPPVIRYLPCENKKEEGKVRVIRSVSISAGKFPKWYVGRTKGADMIATWDCNGWKRNTNPPVQPGQVVKICGF